MIPLETLITFFSASILLALAPGPDNIFVLTQSALRGRGAGLIVTLGLCTGLIFHSTAVTLGLAVIFQKSALAFSILKYIGAAYLLYLAWLAFNAKDETLESKTEQKTDYRKLYKRGIIMNITNPKVSIFFLAFLPQFVDPSLGSVSIQLIMLGMIFIFSAMLIFGAISFFAGSLGEWLKGSLNAQKVLNKIAGLVFISLAIMLIISKQ